MNDQILVSPLEPDDEVITYEEFTGYLKQISVLDYSIIETETSILNCGLKAYDFEEAARMLQSYVRKSEAIFTELCEHEEKEGCPEPVTFAIEYLIFLISTANKMIEIAKKLDGKAKGGKFGFFEYRKEMKEYKGLVKERHLHSLKLENAQHDKW